MKTSQFQISYFRGKKLSGQIVVCFFPLSTHKSQCFKEFYDSPGLNRMQLKKDMRNDNLLFKRVTDIIIPFLLPCKNAQRSQRQVLTSFSPGEKLFII